MKPEDIKKMLALVEATEEEKTELYFMCVENDYPVFFDKFEKFQFEKDLDSGATRITISLTRKENPPGHHHES
jgi:hypothetical protein